MQTSRPHPKPGSGLRHFFTPRPLHTAELSVSGIGIRELMPPCMIERPRGKGDCLIMLFHDSAFISATAERGPLHPPGTIMIWTPGKRQMYGNPDARFSHTWIHCEGSRVAGILRSSRLPLLRPFAATHAPLLQQCLLDIHGELVSYARPDRILVGNLLENALRELARGAASSGRNIRVPENLLAVRRLIGTAPARNITLREMAAMAGMSIPYFCSRFKESFGLPPVECLIRHRMHHAAHLLADRNLNIAQIARQAGYEDPFHFSKTFKKHFGHSPREMRRRQDPLPSAGKKIKTTVPK